MPSWGPGNLLQSNHGGSRNSATPEPETFGAGALILAAIISHRFRTMR